jgi:hypothetical protein
LRGLALLVVALPTYTMTCSPGLLFPLTAIDRAAKTVPYLEIVNPLGRFRPATCPVRV